MDWYNNDLTRKYIILFGSLFDGMEILKYESEDLRKNQNDNQITNVIKAIDVPIVYSNKNKMIERYIRRGDNPNDIKDLIDITLPRIGFEFTKITYDPSRKLNKMHNIISVVSDNGIVNHQFTPVPYNINVEMSVLVKKTEDGTKIIEQILPLFAPSIILTSNLIPENNITLDIPIILNSCFIEELYEIDYTQRRVISWHLSFTIKGYFFGPINNTKVIKEVILNLNDEQISDVTLDPSDALYNSDYGFNIG